MLTAALGATIFLSGAPLAVAPAIAAPQQPEAGAATSTPTPESGMQPASENPKFTGSVSPLTRSGVTALQLFSPLMKKPTVPTDKPEAADPERPPTTEVSGADMKVDNYRGWNVWRITPKRNAGAPTSEAATRYRHRTVIAVHGGGFVLPATAMHWSYYLNLVRATGATVVVPLYPNAPTAHAAGAVPMMADFFTEQMSTYGAANVSVLADSAGAGLALAATQRLVTQHRAVPASLVLSSPWLDLTMSNTAPTPYFDPLLNIPWMRATAQLWAGNLSIRDRRVSPLFGDLRGLPQTFVYSGSVDLLYVDSFALSRKAAATPGSQIWFDLRRGGIHNWAMTLALPEARGVAPMIIRQLLET
jgi:triacylglycerol lipase